MVLIAVVDHTETPVVRACHIANQVGISNISERRVVSAFFNLKLKTDRRVGKDRACANIGDNQRTLISEQVNASAVSINTVSERNFGSQGVRPAVSVPSRARRYERDQSKDQ
uniref:Uncharacterized protein n=1 Tax=uncultured marine virus TaxID=186617 RepID=A0A0F7L5R0_9VIRU|nr:hypothetical protein [uncultured marine virus]